MLTLALLVVLAAGEPNTEPNAASLLAEARQLYDGLEYDGVAPIIDKVLLLPDLTKQQRADALELKANSLAIMGLSVDAEKPFRQLLELNPSFDLPPETSPRIMGVFRKVQVEEKANAARRREEERLRIVQGMQLTSAPPSEVEGGWPVFFDSRLADPTEAVKTMRLQYRRSGDTAYSALTAVRDTLTSTTGKASLWRATIPPDYTSTTDGFTLEYYVQTFAPDGTELISLGASSDPLTIEVLPGEIEESAPTLFRTGWFWVGAAVVLGAAATSTYLLVREASDLPETNLGVVALR
ncbi:MAG: hypothetical protein HYV07_01695 [Deltaproteobacteria bacterium]|nr:hypothetical protein [Deltaproteobacteria bacterium]